MSAPKTKLPKIVRNILYSSIAFVVLALIGYFFNKPEQTSTSTSPNTSVTSAPLTPDEKIGQIVKKFGGENITVKLDSIFVDQGGYMANVEYTIRAQKIGMLSKAMDIMKELYADPALSEIQNCMLRPQTVFIDNYGQESVSTAAKLVLQRSVAQKVVWANLTFDMYENLLKKEGHLWIHPGVR